MLLTLALLLLGLALLVFGADALVRGVSALAAAMGVSPMVIGMTVVAFGTSTPEVVVNVMAALAEQTDLAFGNIIGACSVNLGMVLALTAMIRPLPVRRSVLTREAPLLLLSVAVVVALSQDGRLDHEYVNRLSRADGVVLLILFAEFLYLTALAIRGERTDDALLREVASPDAPTPDVGGRLVGNIVRTTVGLVGVGIGGRVAVVQAVKLASALGVDESLIGLTIVSIGTTLPELTTSILAARRGLADIAIGNAIGSCLFNLLFIGGLVSTIHPMLVPAGGGGDVLLLAVLTGLLIPMVITGRRISRLEGALLMLLYIGYVIYRSITSLS
jgi:cation:H+ antiporter